MPVHIKKLWERANFSPNPQQRDAILHTDGPLFLTAGPGSGKTRVLLWRTLNLIVFHNVPAEDIFLGTFTEKAALQLRQGLTVYLSDATHLTGQPYDISRMPVGTVHSICRRILSDRRFSPGRMRPGDVGLADELDQYFFLLDNWDDLLRAGGFHHNGNAIINEYLTRRQSTSRHGAVAGIISLFNRFSEECLDHERAARRTRDPVLRQLLSMYGAYRSLELTDLSLLQQAALNHCRESDESRSVLRHVIVDEYQDTNFVQESLFFHLAAGYRNLCVVGDDDQALYRFRGSTVENLVEFKERCREKLGLCPRTINLGRNYRSPPTIVEFYKEFIQQIDWKKPGQDGAYRVESKKFVAHSTDKRPAVVASAPGHPDDVCAEVAKLVRRLLDRGKVTDPNQVAFLYPSLKSGQVQRMITALEHEKLKVYAPRAGQFLDVPEAKQVLGVFLVLFGTPVGGASSPGMQPFFEWVESAHRQGKAVLRADRLLAAFVKSRQEQIQRAIADRRLLVAAVGEASLDKETTDAVVACIRAVRKLSSAATSYIRRGLKRLVESRRRSGRSLKAGYVVNRITALSWGILDLFYELMGFEHFRRSFDLAEKGGDEGPVCNLAMVSQYLPRFQARHEAVLSARFLDEGKFVRTFFNSFLYALWRRGESEYEDAEDPFPKGRIPFLTVHQAKGLEFPVVVLGNPRKQESVQKVEEIVRPLLERAHGEPLDRIAKFDVARMFFVALSRPQNLLVLCHYQSQGNFINEPFKTLLDDDFPRIADLDLNEVPAVSPKQEKELPKAYSYTGDFLAYRTCPRRYMIYRRYNFAPARAQTMFFGSLVHRTVEDLHQWLQVQAEAGRSV
jgi:DNA helicase-2/ATP-dependent DNA helicase PcrA